ncbi:MAG: glycyl-radical enzyme activating protein [Planctomycetaceae bacterium]|nr:glycyl-radical enzyme activating protein [Planctomycetaceae bacterium]
MTGIIFDIRKSTIHDGPGTRTTVFFKGCPLQCAWCHSPQVMDPQPQLVWSDDKCVRCGLCIDACPNGGHELVADGSRVHHQEQCTLCGACVDVCHADALVMEGREVTVEQVMAELKRHLPSSEDSGGVTLSGGEPTYQHKFALALLKQSRSEGLHTALDTSGQTPWRTLKKMLPHTDLVLFDINQMGSADPKQHTGMPNGKILTNLTRIGESGVPIVIRIPIVPGINDSREAIENAAACLADVKNITRILLLPYHELGEAKYGRLNRDAYKLNDVEPPEPERMREIAEWMRPCGLDVHVG